MKLRRFSSANRVAALLLATGAGVGVAYGTASGASSTAAVQIAPDPLTWDDVVPGGSQDKPITITSTGSTAAQIVSVTQYGRDRTSFSVVSENCSGQALAPGATCGAVIRFKPTKDGTLVSNVIVSSSNACTRYGVLAGGGRTQNTGARARASACEVVTTPGSTTTATTTTTTTTTTTVPGPATFAPAQTTPTPTGATLGLRVSKCSSRRTVTLHLRPTRGQGFRRAQVVLNGKVVRRFGRRAKGKTITTSIVLKGKPRARFNVTVTATETGGRRYQRIRHFVTCVAKTSTA